MDEPKEGNGYAPTMGGRGDKLWVLLSFLIGAIAVLPVILSVADGGGYDLLRHVVLIEIVVMAILYLKVIFMEFSSLRTHVGLTAERITIARLCRYFGILAFLGAEFVAVNDRIGNDHLNPVTPLVQAGLLLVLISWGLLDSRPVVNVPDEIEQAVNGNDEH